jgi:hypothetical protein
MILDGIGMSASNGNRVIASGTNVGISTSAGYISCGNAGIITIDGSEFTLKVDKTKQSGIYARFA